MIILIPLAFYKGRIQHDGRGNSVYLGLDCLKLGGMAAEGQQ